MYFSYIINKKSLNDVLLENNWENSVNKTIEVYNLLNNLFEIIKPNFNFDCYILQLKMRRLFYFYLMLVLSNQQVEQ